MAKFIQISVAKMKKNSKEAEINEAWRIREEEIHAHELRNPFTNSSWHEAWLCGWLRQHGKGLHSFPSPVLHHKKLWKKSNSPYFKAWRKESRDKHQIFLQKLWTKRGENES